LSGHHVVHHDPGGPGLLEADLLEANPLEANLLETNIVERAVIAGVASVTRLS
jgi:hypothetical protein